jgi:hypothetical protein
VIDSTISDENKIKVVLTAMTDEVEQGGSPITSYSIEWDLGTGFAFTPVVGHDTNNVLLEYTFNSLTKGSVYRFRYRVRNLYGWSAYSDEVERMAAMVPYTPVAPMTSNTQTSVTVAWQLPYNGGAVIESFIL